ncbi:hypothetical protein KP509_07G086200 [Ceratopteris richardii]|uniref:Uncharacterized protein n=1 Tax=Ceratopteris richardii TaxID=49495 RepID=A0A8T2UKA6_CERRI|nr:hypothetical protein KP509_07G086200 [Ceratopteris richardii]KAH7433784.1 hypothetical protein KP509_07G086200 [Ceratopteris richardii]
MATTLHEGANGNVIKDEHVEPLGQLHESGEVSKNPSTDAGNENGCKTPAEQDDSLSKISTPNKRKISAQDEVQESFEDEVENVEDPPKGENVEAEDGGEDDNAHDVEEPDCEEHECAESDAIHADGAASPPQKRRK